MIFQILRQLRWLKHCNSCHIYSINRLAWFCESAASAFSKVYSVQEMTHRQCQVGYCRVQGPVPNAHKSQGTIHKAVWKASLRFIHHHCPLWHTILKCNTPMKTNITHLLQTNWWLKSMMHDSNPLQTWSLLLRGTFIKLWWKYFFKAGGTSNPKAFSKTALLVTHSAGLPNQKKINTPSWFFDPIIRDPFGGLV